MDTIIRRWQPLPQVSAVRTLAGDAALGDLGTLTVRRTTPASTSGDVTTAGGTVRITLSAWDGGTAIEAVALDASAAATRRVLRAVDRAVAGGVDDPTAAPPRPSRCHRGRRAALSPAAP